MSQEPQGFRPSSQQKRLWRRSTPPSVPLAQAVVDLGAGARPRRLREQLDRLLARHEILRTELRASPGLKFPLQVIHSAGDCGLRWEELQPAAAGREGATAAAWWAARRAAPTTDDGGGAALDVAFLPLADGGAHLLLSLPALRADRHSLEVLARELGELYAGEPHGAGDEPLQYADFAAWQGDQEEEGDAALAARNHWRRFETDDPTTPLPEPTGEVEEADVPAAVTRALPSAATDLGVPPRAWVAAAWSVLLQRLDLVPDEEAPGRSVGLVLSGRPLDGLDAMPGPYACTLPLAVSFAPDEPFAEVAEACAAAAGQAGQWQEYARLERFPPFVSVIEERSGPDRGEDGADGFRVVAAEVGHEPAPLTLLCADRADGYGLTVRRRNGTGMPPAERLAGRLAVLLEAAAAQPGTAVADLPLLTDEDRRDLEPWTRTAEDLGPDLPFHRLVDRWVERTPRRPAAVAAGATLTYRQLDESAGRLAARLRRHGVVAGDRVALCCGRRTELVAAILAVLRTGAAYVPVDPSQPVDRSRAMLRDAEPRALLGEQRWRQSVGFGGPFVELAPEAGTGTGDGSAEVREGVAAADEPGAVASRRLAYVIFTSGSTGRPKGVAVAHRALVNYVRAVARRLDVEEGWHYAMVSTFAADLGHTALFTALATGGCVHLVDESCAADPDAFARYVRERGIDVLKIVPSHLGALLAASDPAAVLPRRRLVLGGEAPSPTLLETLAELGGPLRVFNHYGPTEATVGATAGPLDDRAAAGPAPLGRPLANVEVHLLDRRRRPVTPGVVGEIHLGGAGLACGYLGQGVETARHFRPRAGGAVPGARLYATGDLGRLDAGGRLLFLGRADHQVKVRGYRIELGEVEAGLQEHPAVRETVVLAPETTAGQRRLAAYVVLRDDVTATTELRRHLADRLPEYMVPADFVTLDSLPLTANGKVDRAALPDPREVASKVEYVAPRSREEKALAVIWADLLGRERVGVEDNFFDLGGDSILAIRVVARANQQGLRLDPQMIFEHQTVAALATVARQGAAVEAEQGAVTGPCPLLPVQHWFFELPLSHRHHWNQALFLAPVEPLDAAPLARAVRTLVDHHDALRARFHQEPDGWSQELAPPGAVATPFVRVDLGALPADRWREGLEAALAALQGGFDLRRGPLFRVALFTGGEQQRLFLVAHHLVVDAVSWHLLIEDLRSAYGSARDGGTPRLPAKTTSVKRWAGKLAEHATGSEVERQVDFWRRQHGGARLAADDPDGADERWAESRVTVSLEADDTTVLLEGLRSVLRSEVNDVLLAALASAFRAATAADAVCVMLEGHGREQVVDGVDLSRTVGWLTSRFPVLLPVEDDLEATLQAVKDRLREVPDRGVGYGVLRYLDRRPELIAAPPPQLSFNYLGQIGGGRADGDGGDSRSSTLLAVAPESRGDDRHPADRRSHPLAVDGSISGGRLLINLRYSAQRFRRRAVEALAEQFHARLLQLVERVRQGDEVAASATDFPLANLDDAGLAALSDALDEVDEQT